MVFEASFIEALEPLLRALLVVSRRCACSWSLTERGASIVTASGLVGERISVRILRGWMST